ncbi:MAG: hypothetical protein OXC81_03920 [Betaproteobacteria bacterium]|nr:hypothetical protein [Betaproteobacteria bacterium]
MAWGLNLPFAAASEKTFAKAFHCVACNGSRQANQSFDPARQQQHHPIAYNYGRVGWQIPKAREGLKTPGHRLAAQIINHGQAAF